MVHGEIKRRNEALANLGLLTGDEIVQLAPQQIILIPQRSVEDRLHLVDTSPSLSKSERRVF
jgi:hypothetical protein